MAFTVKNWRNTATPVDGAPTPISEAALEDLERRVTDYCDSVVPATGTDPTALHNNLFDAKGDLLVGTGNDTLAKLPLPAGINDHGSTLTTNPLAPSQLEWSVKSADYNIVQAGAVANVNTAPQAAANVTAINNAFGAAAADKRPCLVPPTGTFWHGPFLRMPSNLHVRGFGKGRSIFKTHASIAQNPGGEIITNADFANGNSNITLENFEIDGNRDARGGIAYNPEGVGHMQFRGNSARCTNIRLLNMAIHHAVGVCTGASGIDGFWVEGCEIYSNGRDGCSVLTSSSAPVSRNITYLNNHIYDCGDDCIDINSAHANPIDNVIVANNILGDHPAWTGTQLGGHGLALIGVRNGIVSNNVFPNCMFGGIQLSDGWGPFDPVAPGPAAVVDRILINNNQIYQAGSPYLSTGIGELGYGLEIITRNGNSISDVMIANNQFYTNMSHAIYMSRWGGASTIFNIQIFENDMVGGTGSSSTATAGGIFADQIPINFVQVQGNRIRDMRGKAITGNGVAHLDWTIKDNEIFSCLKGSPGSGGVAVDLTNFVWPVIDGNRVTDFASPKNHSHALGWGGTSGALLVNNNFNESGRTAATLGSPTASQALNVDNGGVLRAGSAQAGSV